jgi:hypothetical protein
MNPDKTRFAMAMALHGRAATAQTLRVKDPCLRKAGK